MKNMLQKREDRILLAYFIAIVLLYIFSRCMISLLDININFSDLDESSVVDGYVAIAEGFGFLFTLFGVMIYTLLYVFLPFAVSITSIILAIIARIFMLGEMKDWKKLGSKIFNVLAVIPLVAIELGILLTLQIAFVIKLSAFIISLVTFIILLVILIYIFKEVFKKGIDNAL